MKIILLFIVSILSVSSLAQKKNACDTMRAGTFKYICGDDTTAVVVIDGENIWSFTTIALTILHPLSNGSTVAHLN